MITLVVVTSPILRPWPTAGSLATSAGCDATVPTCEPVATSAAAQEFTPTIPPPIARQENEIQNRPLSGLPGRLVAATLRGRFLCLPQPLPALVSMVAMKIRSCVMIACMLVVPALALFSHLTPPAAREFLRCSVCDPLCQAISAIDAALPFGAQATLSAGPNAAAQEPVAADLLQPVIAADEPVVATVPQSGTAAALAPADTTAVEALPTVAVSPAVVSTSSVAKQDQPRSQAEWEALASLRTQLASLGATGIDCRPQPGALPGYISSCRIGIDARGQLHRMFHGQGPDAPAAMQSLVSQIQAWQVQQAGTPRQRF
jgi:hypothetical protein